MSNSESALLPNTLLHSTYPCQVQKLRNLQHQICQHLTVIVELWLWPMKKHKIREMFKISKFKMTVSLHFSLVGKLFILAESYLWNVNIWPLWAWHHHSFQVVVFCKRFLGWASCLISSIIQYAVHLQKIARQHWNFNGQPHMEKKLLIHYSLSYTSA